MLPSAEDGVVICQLEFSDGAHADGSLLAVEKNGWLLLVHQYTTAQGRSIPARAWALEQPTGNGEEQPGPRFRVRSMLPAGPVSAT